ncbi:MAG: outer membrane beta-barrel protein [bacterium]
MTKGNKFGLKGMWWRRAPVLIVFLLLFSAPESWAVGNIHLGQMEIHPGFLTRRTYYKMVDVDNPNRGSDWVTAYSPGLKVEWPIRQHTINGDWLLNFIRYHDHDAWNYRGRQLSTRGNFLFGQGGRQLTLDLGHVQNRSDEPAELTESRRMRTENRWTSKLGINLNDNLRLDLSYNLNTYRYKDDSSSLNNSINSLDNRDEDHYETSINVRIKPKTVAFVSGHYYQSDYRDDRRDSDDSETWTVGPGLRWDATAKLSGQIRAGFSWKKYRERDSIDTAVAMVDLTHRASDRTRFAFGLERGQREYSWSEEEFNRYTLNQVRISLDHQLTYKVKVLSGFTYEFDKYQHPRRDSIYAWHLGLRYQIQEWLATDFKYENRHRESGGDQPATDYDNNIFSLSLGLVL